MNAQESLRNPTPIELTLLQRLLEATFPGRDELVEMLRELDVKTIDENGSLELHTRLEQKAPVVKRIPVEAEGVDKDGVKIHILLHAVQGKPVELEIYKEDGSLVVESPIPSELELLVLPSVPNPQTMRSRPLNS
jgi:uncharacterized protein DUF6984